MYIYIYIYLFICIYMYILYIIYVYSYIYIRAIAVRSICAIDCYAANLFRRCGARHHRKNNLRALRGHTGLNMYVVNPYILYIDV